VDGPVLVIATFLKPRGEVFALTDIEKRKMITAFSNSFDANSGHSDTASDRQFLQQIEMQANAPQGGVRYSRAAKGHVKVSQFGALEGQNFGSRIRKSTTEGL
jgi:hypothetical protein